MIRKIIFCQFLILVLGCSTNYEYWDISQFKIKQNALSDNEEIKVIYSSSGPDQNKDLKYYFHVIVISQKTGDTINVLTTEDNGFETEASEKIYNYFSKENPVTKLGQMALANIDTLSNMKHIDEVNNHKLKKISKVARNPDFDMIAENNWPTVIGSIGTLVDCNGG